MKIKTGELSGCALRWAVAQCEYTDGRQIVVLFGRSLGVETYPGSGFQFVLRPDEDWSQGGPIIERERISVQPDENSVEWLAERRFTRQRDDEYWGGPTPLIAAMRCYVDSKLGEEVDVPEELVNVG
jgi:hypothetical protein